jgi:carbamoyl-phosphate synthase large subunit
MNANTEGLTREGKPTFSSVMNVLILSASAKVQLVRSFREAAAERHGKVIAGDIAADSAALHVADEAVLLPQSAEPEFGDQLIKLCRCENIRLVVPTRDGELETLAGLSPTLADQGTTVLVPPSAALSICRDKRRFSEFCLSIGLPVARVHAPGDTFVQFPVFVRPIDGAGGRGARVLRFAEELRELGPTAAAMIVQDFIADQEYTIDVLMDLTGHPVQAVARSRLLIRDGEAQKSRVEDVPVLTDGAIALCEALGLIGHNVVQAFFSSSSGAHFIEVNPRFGGGSSLSIAAGLDSPRRILAMLAGETAAASAKRRIRYGLTMLRHSDDILVDAAEIAALAAQG